MRDVVLVPGTLALLPEYAGIDDPVAELRAAATRAVAWLAARHPGGVEVLTAPTRPDNAARGMTVPPGERIARALLGGTPVVPQADGLLVVANGSAMRTEKAPGHFDERAEPFDAAVGNALRDWDPDALRTIDPVLAEQLWCFDGTALAGLADALSGPVEARLDYDDSPFGVQYWVGRWTCDSF